MVKDWIFSPEMRNKTKISAVSISTQHCTRDSGLGSYIRKRMKGHSD